MLATCQEACKEGKVKLSHDCHADNKGERKYNSHSFLALALDGVVSITLRLHFTLAKGPLVPIG